MLQAHSASHAGNGIAEELPKVRLATYQDIPSLLSIGHDLHDENGLMPLSEERIRDFVNKAVKRDRIICGIIGPIGTVEAMIFLGIGCFWYTDNPHLEEFLAYVRPEFRRSNRAKALLEFAKKSATELNVPLLIGAISQHRTEGKLRLYSRQLGKPAGFFFLYNGKTGT